MDSLSSSQSLALVHELTLSVLSLFSSDRTLEHVLEDMVSKLNLPVLLLWKKQGDGFEMLGQAGLPAESAHRVLRDLKHPVELLALNLPELRVLSDHWCFPLQGNSPFLLQLVFRDPPGSVLQSVLQKLGETLHKALHHRELQMQNLELVNRLQAVLNTSPDGVIFVDHQGIVRSANPRAEGLLGCSLSEHQNLLDILGVQPRLKKMVKRWLTQTVPAGSFWEWGSQPYTLDVRCVPVLMGNQYAYTLYLRNITEAQRTEKKLKETKARLETIVTHLQLGIFLENRDGKVLLWNTSLQEMFGCHNTQENMDAHVLHDQIAENFAEPQQYLTALSVLRQEKKAFLGKVYACHTGRFVEHDAIPILFDHLLTGHLWVFRDVTDKVLSESEKRRLAQFPEKDPNPVLQLSGQGQVLYANIPARYLLSSWHTDLYGRVPEALFSEVLKAKLSGQTLLTDVPFGKRSFQLLAVYFAHEDIFHVYGTDVTSLRQAEKNALALRDHAISASAAKSEFLAVMSHEIRTPLNAVLGMLELLHQQDLSATQTSYVESARGAGENLLTLINHILDFARLESGRLDLHPQPFCLEPLLQQCISVFRYKAEEKGLRLSYEIAEAARAGFLGDAQRIRQILFILVDNALKFTAKGYVKITVHFDQNQVQIDVADSGVGINASQQNLIFERFRQADSSITREYGGTGLGLSIAKELVMLHDGEISVQSVPGKGSCFSVVMPLPEAELPTAPLESIVEKSPETYRKHWSERWSRPAILLVVEDAAENRALMAAYLEGFPLVLHFAHNGHEGIQAWKKYQPDLTLMDMQMPVLDGLSATRAIQQLAQDSSPRIVALTADASEQAAQAATEAGCLMTLTKPLSQRILLKTLDELLLPLSTATSRPAPIVPKGPEEEPGFRFLPQLAPIYPVFFNSRRQELERFEKMLAAQSFDWEHLERMGHSLKGSGASFGFPLLSGMGGAIEQLAQTQNIQGLEKVYKQMAAYVLEVQPQIEALMQSRK